MIEAPVWVYPDHWPELDVRHRAAVNLLIASERAHAAQVEYETAKAGLVAQVADALDQGVLTVAEVARFAGMKRRTAEDAARPYRRRIRNNGGWRSGRRKVK